MTTILSVPGYELDFEVLYQRLWAAAVDQGDGTRLYISAGDYALKWIIADLAGTPAQTKRRMIANSDLRDLVYATLDEVGWADRVNQRVFLLLVDPNDAAPTPVDNDQVTPTKPIPSMTRMTPVQFSIRWSMRPEIARSWAI